MTPTDIKGSTINMVAPSTAPDVQTVRARKAERFGYPCIETAWIPSQPEMDRMVNGQPVILSVMGGGMPPVLLSVELPVCDVCGLDVEEGEETTIGGARHLNCNGIAWEEMTAEQKEAGIQQLTGDLEEALRDPKSKYVNLPNGKWMAGETLAKQWQERGDMILRLAQIGTQQTNVVKWLFRKLDRINALTKEIDAVAGDEHLQEIAELSAPGPQVIEVAARGDIAADEWRAKHDALGRAILGLSPDDTAHNFDHPGLLQLARGLRERRSETIDGLERAVRCLGATLKVAGAHTDISQRVYEDACAAMVSRKQGAPQVIDTRCTGCCKAVGGTHNNTEADPCPQCGAPF